MKDETYKDTWKLAETFERLAKAEWRKKPVDGIKASEIRVLLCIDRLSSQKPVTISHISKRMSITSPTVTQLVKSLCTSGYVSRTSDVNDRRVAEINLTTKGEKIVRKVYCNYRGTFSGLIESLGKEKTETLISLLDEVYAYLEVENNKE